MCLSHLVGLATALQRRADGRCQTPENPQCKTRCPRQVHALAFPCRLAALQQGSKVGSFDAPRLGGRGRECLPPEIEWPCAPERVY